MTRDARTDAGNYITPAVIKAPAAYSDNGQGGNANAGQYTTVCSPMIHLYSAQYGRGARRAFQFGQLYPTVTHFAEMRWRSDTPIDATMILVVHGRTYQILGAIDPDYEHVKILMPCVEYQAQGTKEVS